MRRNLGIKILIPIFMMITVLVAPLVTVISQPVMFPVIVNMNPRSEEVNIAIGEITNGINAKVVNYGSFEHNLFAMKAIGMTIYVGHGSPDGIYTKGKIVSYETLVNNNPAKNVIFLACHSSKGSSIKTSRNIIGFNGEIDSILAANIIKYYVGKEIPQYAKNENVPTEALYRIVQRSIDLNNGQKALPLGSYLIPHHEKPNAGLTEGEFALHAVTLTLCMLSLFAPLTALAISRVINVAVSTLVLAGYAVAAFSAFCSSVAILLESIDDFQSGESSLFEFAADVIGLCLAFSQVVIYIIGFLYWWEAIAAGIIFAGEKTANLVIPVMLALLAASIIAIALTLDNVIRDYNDSNYPDPPPPPPGGGCVAKGTKILLADGKHSKEVQRLKIGDWVLGYNISSGETVPVQVTNIIEEEVSSLLVIVHERGKLKVTPVNQPIYMRNASYTGWLTDPQNLKIGDQIFHVPTQSWVMVLNFKSNTGHFKVYDVVTDPLNVFVGNGILLDMKR